MRQGGDTRLAESQADKISYTLDSSLASVDRIEQTAEEGRAAYLASLVHDTQTERLEISFVRHENLSEIYGILTFFAVKEYRTIFESDEDQAEIEAGILLDNLLGIIERTGESDTAYCIVTTSREINFRTTETARWSPV